MRITVAIDPSLDDLQALQGCTFRIGGCHHDEAGRFSVTAGAFEIPTHADTCCIGTLDAIRTIEHCLVEAITGEKAQSYARARRGKDLLAAKSAVDRLSRILLGPDRS